MRLNSTPLLALALCAFLASPSLAQSVEVGNQKTLIETIHFGDFYLPGLIVAGSKIHAMWRPKEQSGLERIVSTSKNGGKKFGKQRRIRIPGLFVILHTTGDAAGYSYFTGLLGDGSLAVVRGDAKLKNFTTSTPVSVEGGGIVGAQIAFAPDGSIFLAVHRQLNVYTSSGIAQSDQVYWTRSTDGGATFNPLTVTNDRPYETAEYKPAIAVGPTGAIWLVTARDAMEPRAAEGDLFNDARIFVRRLDADSLGEVEISRGTAEGRIYDLEAVASPSGVRVMWAELGVGGGSPVQKVYFSRLEEGGEATTPQGPIATVGIPHFPHLVRSGNGQIIVFMHGAGYDSSQPEPAIIAVGSYDDGLTFGPIKQVTGYPPITTFNATSDANKIYGLWTDTRLVQFATFSVRTDN